ncbi:hypothetical protein ABDD95_11655 [Mucilaginibacter sp. PAMB04274]|uniref:hypothetical protein n=1 Tax=Mucilaginibacter sp. PAMB04274 TaxID=3138568 RepID=UPI0031F71330
MTRFKRSFLTLTIIFLIAFPKGGFKISGIPLTWGYLILMLSSVFCLVGLFIDNSKIYFKKERLLTLQTCLPYIAYTGLVLLTKDVESFGFLFSYILSVLFMPIMFLMVFNRVIDNENFNVLFTNVFLWCLRFVIVFGLLLFVYKLKSNRTIEIPFLTVNIDDTNSLEEKFNSRGDFFKLVSTYNNGNIFGVCMLIFAPLYMSIEKYKFFRLGFFIALFLTLSRTVWIGTCIYFLLIIFRNLNGVKGWTVLVCALVFLTFCVPLALNLLNLDLSFLFDKNLGGRLEQLSALNNITLFGEDKFKGIGEIVYTSVLQEFGVIGLVLYLGYISAPLIIYYIKKKKFSSTNLHWSLIIYIIISASDGAILYIPTMAFYWFVASYLFKPIPKNITPQDA